jgi:Zn-dependent protease
MLLAQLFSDPWLTVATLVAFLIALSVHEASHALAAFWLGDRTAYREKRLTLNPFSHIDWTGFLMLVTVGFGWGKPVPFNPYNLKWQRIGPALIAAAGPISNFLLGVVATLGFAIAFASLGPTNLLKPGRI